MRKYVNLGNKPDEEATVVEDGSCPVNLAVVVSGHTLPVWRDIYSLKPVSCYKLYRYLPASLSISPPVFCSFGTSESSKSSINRKRQSGCTFILS